MNFQLRSVSDLKICIQKNILPILKARQIVLLKGEMGAGKTEFVRQLVGLLGSIETASPSFAVHHSYDTTRGRVDHLDLYRTSGPDDLASIGLWDLFAEPSGLIIIEWAERLGDVQLPPAWSQMTVSLNVVNLTTGERLLSI